MARTTPGLTTILPDVTEIPDVGRILGSNYPMAQTLSMFEPTRFNSIFIYISINQIIYIYIYIYIYENIVISFVKSDPDVLRSQYLIL